MASRRRVISGQRYNIDSAQSVIDNPRNKKILREIQGINNRIIRNNLHQKPNLKVSYCTTCYNRFWQLSKILGPNFNQVKDDPDIEFVVVDFRGSDSQKIQDYILENFTKELQSGRLKYYRRKGTIKPFVWNVAIAKNVVHRLATGDIVVNLDGDNFIQPYDSRIIRYYFNQINNLLFHQNWCNIALINMFRSLRLKPEKYDVQPWAIFGTNRGTFGRIAVTRKDFMRLGGYNEQMVNMGNQDTDLIFRAMLSDFHYLVSSPRSDGSPKASIVNASDIQSKQLKHNRQLTQKAFKTRNYIVNQNGFKENLDDYHLILNSKSELLENTTQPESKNPPISNFNEVPEVEIPVKSTPESSEAMEKTPKIANSTSNTNSNNKNVKNRHLASRGDQHSRKTSTTKTNNKCPHCGEIHSDDEL